MLIVDEASTLSDSDLDGLSHRPNVGALRFAWSVTGPTRSRLGRRVFRHLCEAHPEHGIDEGASRAEAYVDITRGRRSNHLFVTRASDSLDGEHLPKAPAHR